MKIKLIKEINDFLKKFKFYGLLIMIILYLLGSKFDSIEAIALGYLIIYFTLYFFTYYHGKSAIIVFPKKIKECIKGTFYYKRKTKNNIMLFLVGLIIPVFSFLLVNVYLGSFKNIADIVIMMIAYTLIIFTIYFLTKRDLPNIDNTLMEIYGFSNKDEDGNFHTLTREYNVSYLFNYDISFWEDKWSTSKWYGFGVCFISGTIIFEKYELFMTEEQLERLREKYYFIDIRVESAGNKIFLSLHNKYHYNKIINSKYVVGTIVSMCELANDIVNYKEME